MDEFSEDLPIVGLCVVTEPGNCPLNYTLIEKTYNGTEEADLWKDGIFGRRVTRYMCLERAVPAENQDVLVDVSLTLEKDPVPPGFTVVEFTHVTREKAIKKQCLCIRWMNSSMTSSAITDLIFMSKGTRRPPAGYTLIGEMNHLSLCYKMGKLPKQESESKANLPYQLPTQGKHYNMVDVRECLPYATKQPAGNLIIPCSNALSGVPWEFNANIQNLGKLTDISCPSMKYKSMMDIENETAYIFGVPFLVLFGIDIHRTSHTVFSAPLYCTSCVQEYMCSSRRYFYDFCVERSVISGRS